MLGALLYDYRGCLWTNRGRAALSRRSRLGIWARGWRGDRRARPRRTCACGMRSWRGRQDHGPAAPRCRRRGRRFILIGPVNTAGRGHVAQRPVPGGWVTALRQAALVMGYEARFQSATSDAAAVTAVSQPVSTSASTTDSLAGVAAVALDDCFRLSGWGLSGRRRPGNACRARRSPSSTRSPRPGPAVAGRPGHRRRPGFVPGGVPVPAGL
jgi:hypothetical protein